MRLSKGLPFIPPGFFFFQLMNYAIACLKSSFSCICQSNEHIEMIISVQCLPVSKASLCHYFNEDEKIHLDLLKAL